MSDRIVLNTPRYKGEFPLDLADETPTALEWRWVKKISGYLPGTAAEGIAGSDPDLTIAFAVIALARAGRIRKDEALQVADELSDLPFDGNSIAYVVDTMEEAEADPPAAAAAAPVTELPSRSTGGSSPSTSDTPEPDQSLIGARAWGRSAT